MRYEELMALGAMTRRVQMGLYAGFMVPDAMTLPGGKLWNLSNI